MASVPDYAWRSSARALARVIGPVGCSWASAWGIGAAALVGLLSPCRVSLSRAWEVAALPALAPGAVAAAAAGPAVGGLPVAILLRGVEGCRQC
jgi:hypothetical protein